MKKSALVLGSLLVVGVIAAPKIVGYKISSSVNEVVDTINQTPGYSATVTTMDSGWFTTTANIEVTVDASKLATILDVKNGNPSLQIVLDASHGPFLGGESAGLGWAVWSVDVAGDSLREIADWEQGTSLYHMEGSAGLLGSVNYSQIIPAFTVETAIDDTTVNFSGHQGAYSGSDMAYNSVDGTDITVTSPKGTINASFKANLVNVKPFPASIDDALAHGLMTGEVKADKAATEFILDSVFEQEFASYEFPRNKTEEEIKTRAHNKKLFALAVLDMQKLVEVTDAHYSAEINLENNQLTVHKKVISLPI